MKKIFATFLLFLCATACGSSGLQNGLSYNPLVLAYAEPAAGFSPLSYEAKDRKYLGNFYEPLLRFDAQFNLESALAVSWGRLDETTWDFHLREGVLFHNGEAFTADDVVYALNQAASSPDSELRALLSGVASVQKIDATRIEIHTLKPDALFLSKLTYVYIFPNGMTDFEVPVGTGPYRLSSYSQDSLAMERFEAYWGPLAYYPSVALKAVPLAKDREQGLLKGDFQVLATVPPQSVSLLEAQGFKRVDFPSLELSSLLLSTRGVFKDPELRAAVAMALSSDYADSFGGDYLLNTSQYAARGIFGYEADAPLRTQNLEEAQVLRGSTEELVSVTLDLPQGLEDLGAAIAQDLAKIQVEVTVNPLSPSDLEAKIQSGASDFYFFGWKYDLADASDFLTAVAHSETAGYGQFNGMGYANSTLDKRIEALSSTLDVSERHALLKEAFGLLSDDHVILPLFESENLYFFEPALSWNLRLDGQLWASDIFENVVE